VYRVLLGVKKSAMRHYVQNHMQKKEQEHKQVGCDHSSQSQPRESLSSHIYYVYYTYMCARRWRRSSLCLVPRINRLFSQPPLHFERGGAVFALLLCETNATYQCQCQCSRARAVLSARLRAQRLSQSTARPRRGASGPWPWPSALTALGSGPRDRPCREGRGRGRPSSSSALSHCGHCHACPVPCLLRLRLRALAWRACA
jgi:hypothetical protein